MNRPAGACGSPATGDSRPGYEGTALTLLFDPEEDPGAYYWQASYYADPDDAAAIAGPVRSFVIGAPGAAPSAEVVQAPVEPERMLRWRLGPRGLGPVRIGMGRAAVERVTGREIVPVSREHPSCRLWRLRGAPKGLSLMVADGRLARVEAYRGRWRSSRGIGIGDRARKVRRRYPGVRSRPHPYVPRGEYLIVGGRRRMIFETDPPGRVTSFRGGRAREVGYIEGTVSGCHAQTLRGMKWTVTRLETAAPQVLAG